MGKLASFAAGFGTGYINSERQNKLDAEREADRANAAEDRALKMEEVNRLKRERQERMDEAAPSVTSKAVEVTGISPQPAVYEDAAVAGSDVRMLNRERSRQAGLGVGGSAANTEPVAVVPEGAVPVDKSAASNAAQDTAPPAPAAPATTPAIPAATVRPLFGVGDKKYSTLAEAQKDPAAMERDKSADQRMVSLLKRQGNLDGAINLEANQLKLNEAKLASAKLMQAEGVEAVSRAAIQGDAAGVFKAMNAAGQYKVEGDVVATPVTKDIPGVGKKLTYDYQVTLVNPDGTRTPKTFNSHDLAMLNFSTKEILAQDEVRRVEANKSTVLPLGAQIYGPDGKLRANNTNTTAADARLMNPGGSGFGGKNVMTPAEQAVSSVDVAVERILTKSEGKLAPDVTAKVSSKAQALHAANPTMQPNLAAEIAYNISADPSRIKPTIDVTTGAVVGGYKHPSITKPFAVSEINRADVTSEQMKAATKTYLGTLNAADRKDMLSAAFTNEGRSELTQRLYKEIADAGAVKGKKEKATAAEINAWVIDRQETLQKHLQAKVDLVFEYGDRPPAAKAAPAGGTTPTAPILSAPGPGIGKPAPSIALTPAMKTQITLEKTEMGAGTRRQFSPDIKAYLDQQKAISDAADNAASQASRDAEFRAATARRQGVSQASQSLAVKN